jgi:hypothetical protein
MFASHLKWRNLFVCFFATRFSYCFHTSRVAINHMTLCIVALLTHYLTCLALFFLPLDPVYFFTNLFLLQISSAPFFPLAIGLNSITQCFHWMFNILTYCNHKFTVYQFYFKRFDYLSNYSSYQYLLGHGVIDVVVTY